MRFLHNRSPAHAPPFPLTRAPAASRSPEIAHFAKPSLALTMPLALLELELVEPALFFEQAAEGGVDAAGALADALKRRLDRLDGAS